jgi:exopolysaccharide biosynthesis polyprenyl glycosylphosphotransferase
MEAQQEILQRLVLERRDAVRPAWRGTLRIPLKDRPRLARILDLVVLNASIAAGLALSEGIALFIGNPFLASAAVVLANLLWLLLADTFDAYRIATLLHPRSASARGLKCALVMAIIGIIPAIILPGWISPALAASAILLFAIPAHRAAMLGVFASRAEPILFFGSRDEAQTLARYLGSEPMEKLTLVGYYDGREPKGPSAGDIPFLGSLDQFDPQDFLGLPVTLVVSNTYLDSETLQDKMVSAIEAGIEIHTLAGFVAQLSGRIPLESIQGNPQALPLEHPGNRTLFQISKRAMDIFLASLGLIFLAPLFPFIALAIYLESPGPIFYRQKRVGKGGREFVAYKFRSMVPEAERDKALWASDNDHRVTHVGRLLRKTHLDEFPQFINILKGEMSAVGPRPERPEFVAELAREIPFYRARHAVKPGMAGWALVNQGYVSSKEDARIKHEYDLYYIKHQSLWFDLVILCKTVLDTVTLGGR